MGKRKSVKRKKKQKINGEGKKKGHQMTSMDGNWVHERTGEIKGKKNQQKHGKKEKGKKGE